MDHFLFQFFLLKIQKKDQCGPFLILFYLDFLNVYFYRKDLKSASNLAVASL